MGVSDAKATDVYYTVKTYDETSKVLTETRDLVSATDVTSTTTALDGTTSQYYYVPAGDMTINERISVSGDVTLILDDGAMLTCGNGITVSKEDSLTITVGGKNDSFKGNGTLIATASGMLFRAGIGGGSMGSSGGTVIINGGIVKATGKGSAGIGGAGSNTTAGGSGGIVIINGGIVTATGNLGGAGIGGANGKGSCGSGGTVIINDGTVEAMGTYGAAGIGGGSYTGSGGTVIINGGTVTAKGGGYNGGAAGIGGARDGSGGTVTINGGIIIATGGGKSAGIGAGCNNSGGTLTINGNTAEMIVSAGSAATGGALNCESATATPIADSDYLVSVNYGGGESSTTTDKSSSGAEYDLLDGTAALGTNKYGKIRFVPNGYLVTFDPNGGMMAQEDKTYIIKDVENGGQVKAPETPPSRLGYTFSGWYADAALITEFDFVNTETNKVKQDTTIYAKWTLVTYVVTIDADGGNYSEDKSLTVNFGDTITLATPTKDKSVFVGWTATGNIDTDSAAYYSNDAFVKGWKGTTNQLTNKFMNLSTT